MSPPDEQRLPAASNNPIPPGVPHSPDDAEIGLLLGQLRDPNLRFPARPAFAADLDVFEMPDGLGFQFRGAETPVILRGRKIAPVVAFLRARLDGTSTLDSLVDICPPEIGVTTLLRSLLLLHGKGLVVDDGASTVGTAANTLPGGETLRRQLLYWGRHLDVTRSASSSSEVQRRLETADVAVVGTGVFGAVTADLLARTGCSHYRVLAWDDGDFLREAMHAAPVPPLEFAHLETTAIDPALEVLQAWIDEIDLLVTATCDAPNVLFRGINNLSLRCRCPWLHANTDGSTINIGPLVHPFESSCYTCVELRTRSAQAFAIEEEIYQARLAVEREAGERGIVGEAVWAATLAASIVVGEAFRVTSGVAPATLVDNVLRLTPVTGVVEQNHVTRVPRCPDCYRGGIPPHTVEPPEAMLRAEALTP